MAFGNGGTAKAPLMLAPRAADMVMWTAQTPRPIVAPPLTVANPPMTTVGPYTSPAVETPPPMTAGLVGGGFWGMSTKTWLMSAGALLVIGGAVWYWKSRKSS